MRQRIKSLMWLCVALFSAVLAVACGPILEELPDVPKAERETQSKDNRDFAVSFYQKIALAKSDTNLFFSPYSISSALGMTSGGAKGQTATEINKVMRFSLPQEKLHPAFSWLTIDLNNRGKMGDFQLSVANRIWGHKDYGFNQDFVKLLESNYKAGLAPVDFQNKAEEARTTINDWVAQQTQNKIKDLIKPGLIKTNTQLVLTNAIYFKGSWSQQFKSSATHEQDFFMTKDNKVKVQMMVQKFEKGAKLSETKGARLLELPYAGGQLSMVVILPNTRHALPTLEKELTREKLDQWLSQTKETTVKVSLPKFKIAAELDLKKILISMGMTLSFSEKADFSGISKPGEQTLQLTDAVHKAFVEVNEEGTEAAAATAVIGGFRSAPVDTIPTFIADQPFLFLIRDRSTGATLFMGRFAKPTTNN